MPSLFENPRVLTEVNETSHQQDSESRDMGTKNACSDPSRFGETDKVKDSKETCSERSGGNYTKIKQRKQITTKSESTKEKEGGT